jgi:hypothetical protein
LVLRECAQTHTYGIIFSHYYIIQFHLVKSGHRIISNLKFEYSLFIGWTTVIIHGWHSYNLVNKYPGGITRADLSTTSFVRTRSLSLATYSPLNSVLRASQALNSRVISLPKWNRDVTEPAYLWRLASLTVAGLSLEEPS